MGQIHIPTQSKKRKNQKTKQETVAQMALGFRLFQTFELVCCATAASSYCSAS
jgi:hypothetical protein